MRVDDQIHPLALLKKYTILNAPWTVESDDDRVKQYFDEIGFRYLGREFYSALFEMLTAFDYGFSLTEPVFKVTDVPGHGQRVVLSQLCTRPPHTFEFVQNDYGTIEYAEQQNTSGPLKVGLGKMIYLVNQGEFDNPYGKSDYNLGVYQAWWSKKIVVRFMNIFLERFGAPTVLAQYKQGGASKEQLAEVKKLIGSISAKSGFMFPDTFQMSLLQAQSGRNPFTEAINLYNMMISRALLNPDLTGMGGSEISGGSYSLGKEQFDLWYTSLELPKRNLISEINKRIVWPLVLWNFGPEALAATPGFTFLRLDQSEKTENGKIYLEALKSGKVKPILAHLNTFLQSIDYPAITEEEWAEQKEASAIALDGLRKAAEAKGNEQEEGPAEDKPEMDDKDDSDNVKRADHAMRELSRKPTVWEEKIDFARRVKEIDDIEAQYMKLLGEQYQDSINRLAGKIRSERIVENRRLDKIQKLTLPGADKLKRLYKQMITAAYNYGEQTARTDLGRADHAVGNVSSLKLEEIAQWITLVADLALDADSGWILTNASYTLQEAIRQGWSVKEAITELDKALQSVDIGLNPSRLENIVRTNVSRAMNQARLDTFGAVGDNIVAYQYSSIMDARTTPLCLSLDTKVFRPSEADKYNPPNHYQCRSTLIPILKDEEVLKRKSTGKEPWDVKYGDAPFKGYDTMPAVERDGGFLKLKEGK